MGVDNGMHEGEELLICELGLTPYREAIDLQRHLSERRQRDELPDVLLLLEHPPVYTRGRRAAEEELPLPEEFYRSVGIEVLETDRGGRITYHGPGQLVGYPIMRVGEVVAHLRAIEVAIIAALAEEGVGARSRSSEGPDYTGVWVAEREIASIGVHVRSGITTHGFAINVDNDLEPFSWVVACGLTDTVMTSLARELSGAGIASADGFRGSVARHFCEVHGRSPLIVSRERLGIAEIAA